ncbi:50S ribosomal protein L25/general stress protein Ctc [Roseateles amylovorans]|uniref:Large ribosomal subunit protein bL25 n=1 Tax=Roseateles amylovorans TaxID=2978473 RepID=A0ABY6AXP6_9BURK|nr:50S ribosomal protein L25/general stress protein Ctc [Roseateles amylovorans]UXH77447.1 50S ribosomal protein L25/general stress protein Ctc [Roseateles amylovorans]
MKFVAFERKLQGTGASRRLRNAGKVPGIVYGAGEPASIELDHNALFHAMKKEAFHSSILDMELNGTNTQVLLRDYQMHPYKQQVLHVDFQRVDATTKITKKVPLHFVGEAESPAVKTDKGTVNHVITQVEITCLAQQLPEFIEVDLSNLTMGHSVHVNDLKVADHIKIVTHGKPNPVVATPVPAAVEEIIVAAAPAPDAGKKKKK